MIRVDVAAAASFEQVLPLLDAACIPPFAPHHWRPFFDYSWPCEETMRGFVLKDEERIVGFVATIFSERIIEGRLEKFADLTMVTLPEYRDHSADLFEAVMGMQNRTFTCHTAGPSMEPLYRRFGFQTLETKWIVFRPLPGLGEPAGWFRGHVTTNPELIATELRGVQREYFVHLRSANCQQMLVTYRGAKCHVVFSQSNEGGAGFSRIHHISNGEIFRACLEHIGWRMALKNGTATLAIDRRLLEGPLPSFGHETQLPQAALYRSERLRPEQIDNLYSAVTILGPEALSHFEVEEVALRTDRPSLPRQDHHRALGPHALREIGLRAACRISAPFLSGRGCILTLHRVVPEGECSGLPSIRALEIAPRDLRDMVQWLQRRHIEAISLDDLPERMTDAKSRPFVCFTFDDGYRDNASHALPIFQEFGVPFSVNITNGFLSGTASAWWYVLEAALLTGKPLRFLWKGREHCFSCSTLAERISALDFLGNMIRGLGMERDALIAAIAEAAELDPREVTRSLCLTWDELRKFSEEPLVTIGAHTASHHSLNRLSDAELVVEISGARQILAEQLGREVRHFAYPFGGPDDAGEREFAAARSAGFTTMLTTRPGNLSAFHIGSTDRLPRITVSGNYPVLRSLPMAVSGITSWRETRSPRGVR